MEHLGMANFLQTIRRRGAPFRDPRNSQICWQLRSRGDQSKKEHRKSLSPKNSGISLTDQLMSSEQALIQKKDKEIEILRRRLEGLVKDDSQSEASVHADQVQNVSQVC
jgi:hypothetical protein